jgi:lauroyl/myristoyl acyltransferase
MKILKIISALLFWVGYQILIKLPFGVRRMVIIIFIFITWINRLGKIKKNIRLLSSYSSDCRINQIIKQLKKTTAENQAFLLGSKSINIEKEIERLEVTGEIDWLLDLLRSGKKIIIVSPHTGPYDIALILFARYLEQRLAPSPLRVFILFENIPIIDTVTTDLRRVAGDSVHFERAKKGETLTKADEYLNKGYAAVFGFDIIRKNSRGVLCKIGNAEGIFQAGWAVLAVRTDATVVPLFPSSGENGKIRVAVGSPFEVEKTGDEIKDIENNIRRLVELYGPFLRDHLGEWLQLIHSDFVKTQILKRG